MVKVKEVLKVNKNTAILVCDMFSDADVKSVIRSNIGVHKRFEIEQVRPCFSNPTARNIVLFGSEDHAKITEIEFE